MLVVVCLLLLFYRNNVIMSVILPLLCKCTDSGAKLNSFSVSNPTWYLLIVLKPCKCALLVPNELSNNHRD